MVMEEYRSVEKYRRKHGQSSHNYLTLQNAKLKQFFISFFNRFLIVIMLSLFVLIGCKNPYVKSFIEEHVYHTNLQFTKFKGFYEKYFGNILPFQKQSGNEKPVFQEQLIYQDAHFYKDGVALEVGEHYLVPIIESGIIVYIGEKEGYGNTVIIQQVNGIDVWYSNVTIAKDQMKLYDYVEKGSLLGGSMTNQIYLVFQKEGSFLNYQDYLQ